ncbi:AlbA family DNA-binding domain-containing protein [Pontibacter indicus]|uniref:Putative DNA-binding domain-containing protein n=1 Tax=Pontibacter indicus TaxID=1317125 RepID=A0A1R3XJ62_9BACT|nr:ATP-binding protein [Pontibacter indicus]SIT91579.1 Putative DNA-binding domain-containing protein [Pontibacter indicus]
MISILDKDIITEDDLQSLITLGVEESINLDFKAAGSIDITDKKKAEIAKDVSAFANSAGGMIIYGINEVNHKASSFSPIDGNTYTKEWLEQIIQTRIQRKIENLKIIPVRIDNDIHKSIYVIKIPESSSAPHMTSDKKFYKRYNFESVQMEEYEIRNLYNRKDKTELVIHNILSSPKIKFETNDENESIAYLDLKFQVKNISKAIEKDYKLIVQLNFRDYSVKFRVNSNYNHNQPDANSGSISFHGLSPIFPDEVLTIGEFELGVKTPITTEFTEQKKLHMLIHDSCGTGEMIIPLADLYDNIINLEQTNW